MSLVQRALAPIVDVREQERTSLLLMFGFSFLAMTAYNAVKPITRSAFIRDLGADNLPWVLFAAGLLIGLIMTGYSWLMARLPERWGLTVVQLGMAAVLVLFWALFQTGQEWVSVAFYLWGLVLGLLLISQFWTVANLMYDPRQAKRLFGFIGGGAPLGGVAGSFIAVNAAAIGTYNLLLLSAVLLIGLAGLVAVVVGRMDAQSPITTEAAEQAPAVSGFDAWRLLRQTDHLKIIALVISFAAIGAAIIEQQLNMAAEANAGREDVDAITAFLGLVGVWMSGIAFFVQVWLTSRIHRFLGIGFALVILPIGLGATAIVMLLNAALWAPALARILDQSLRYTVDKTSREILFLPLPAEMKLRAKAFVDVTVDRVAKASAALLLLILVQPWGLALGWQQLSFASLGVMGLWLVMARRARQGYLAAFRRGLEHHEMQPEELRLDVADLSTIETLVEELAHPDEQRVLYAIDILESLDKRSLVTPLLLHHVSAAVRVRALAAISAARPEIAAYWLPTVQRMVGDHDPDVRAAAVSALASIRNEDAAALARPLLDDADPRIVATAAIVLVGTGREEDAAAAEAALARLAADSSAAASHIRHDVAAAIRQIDSPRARQLLIPLLYDADPEVAEEAMRTIRELGATDFLFVPSLISLLRRRRLKSSARAVLVEYGEPVLDALALFLRDHDEDLWVRRHLPATIARIPCQKAVDALVAALSEPDSLLRHKVVTALDRLRRLRPDLKFPSVPIEAFAMRELRRHASYLTLSHNLFVKAGLSRDLLLAGALDETRRRTLDRLYRLLGLLYAWDDVAAARWAIERGDARGRASALEYLDNILAGNLRKHLMPVLEDLPVDERIRRAHVLLKSRPRDVEETLLELINDEDQVIAATAIDLVRQRRIWSLLDDVHHVLTHRSPSDRFALEAAAQTLAAGGRGEDELARRWRGQLATVDLVERIRGLDLFASVGVNELFWVAAAGRQARYEPGHTLFDRGAVPESLEVLLEGAVAVAGRSDSDVVRSPALLGVEEILRGTVMAETLRTTEPSVALALGTEGVRTLFSDNADLVQGLFRTLAARISASERALIVPSQRRVELRRLAADGLSAIDKVLALQTVSVFSHVSAGEMLHLASIAHEVPLTPGASVKVAGDPPAMYVLLSGALSTESPDGSQLRAVAGDAVGIFEVLVGSALRGDPTAAGELSVVERGTALRIEGDDLSDLLGHRPELVQQLFTALFTPTAPHAAVG